MFQNKKPTSREEKADNNFQIIRNVQQEFRAGFQQYLTTAGAFQGLEHILLLRFFSWVDLFGRFLSFGLFPDDCGIIFIIHTAEFANKPHEKRHSVALVGNYAEDPSSFIVHIVSSSNKPWMCLHE